jgi:hypothetical protein
MKRTTMKGTAAEFIPQQVNPTDRRWMTVQVPHCPFCQGEHWHGVRIGGPYGSRIPPCTGDQEYGLILGAPEGHGVQPGEI